MSKSSQILSLYDGVRSTREIADIVGCLPEYVRIVARQRRGRASETDRKYLESDRGLASRRRSSAKLAGKTASYYRSASETGNRAVAAERARQVYRSARIQGKSVREAGRLYSAAYRRVLLSTCDRTAARAAYAGTGAGE